MKVKQMLAVAAILGSFTLNAQGQTIGDLRGDHYHVP